MRDDFTQQKKWIIAHRVAGRCSMPGCGVATFGPQTDSSKAMNVGVAAHITAASPGGPRYDSNLTEDDRRKPENGIWLCATHAKLIDSDEQKYTVELLRQWRHQTEAQAVLTIGQGQPNAEQLSAEELEILASCAEQGDIWVMSASQVGSWVRAENRDFFDPGDPAYAVAYTEALEFLEEKGLACWNRGQHYKLTSAGFRTGRTLKKHLDSIVVAELESPQLDDLDKRVLRALADGDGANLDLGELQSAVDAPVLRIDASLEALERMVLVERGPDWRQVDVVGLTPKGRDLVIELGFVG